MLTRIIAALGLCAVLAACASVPEASSSRTQFIFDDWAGPPLTIYAVEPASAGPDAPVVFVMHGVNRNADEYRDNWVDLAEQYGLRVYVPEFDGKRFKGAEGYNLGGLAEGGVMAFDAIEPLFQSVQAERGSTTSGYYLFGHSAGAQFVHRAICYSDMPHLAFAISANAGWYTLPSLEDAWPYGLADAPDGACTVAEWLQMPMLIMLGTADIDPNDPNLRRTKEAMAQGPNRFQRGRHFYELAQAQAEADGVTFGWRVKLVEGVAHDNRGMALAAAPMIAADASARVKRQGD